VKCVRNNDIYGAIEYYTLALQRNPTDLRILSTRAEYYLQGRLPDLALADCERILEICHKESRPEHNDVTFTWPVYYRRMRALIGLQLYEQAQLSIDPALTSNEDSSIKVHSGIVDRFQRMINIDIPRLKRHANGHYTMADMIPETANTHDEFTAEFEQKDAYEFRACEQTVKRI
jgi:tetratricopeptide (TPR) repeat protein